MTDVSSVRQQYTERLAARRADLSALQARFDVISWGRLVCAVGAIGLLAGVWIWGLPGTLLYGVGGLVIAFVVLVVLHAKVAAARARKLAAVALFERALDRMSGKWTAFTSDGKAFLRDDHAYALDLDIFGPGSLFQLLDDTRTPFGQQTLAGWLSSAAHPMTARARQDALREISSELEFREAMFVVGSVATDQPTDPDRLLAWSQAEPTLRASKGLLVLAWVLPVVLISALSVSGSWKRAMWIAALTFVGELAILGRIRAGMQPIIDRVSGTSRDLERFSGMLALLERREFRSEALRALQAPLRASGAPASVEIARLARLVGMLEARNNGVFGVLIGPALLWDLHWCHAIERWQERAGRASKGWFDAIGSAEALCSLAGFCFEHPDYTFPELDDTGARFEATALGHPLLGDAKRVCNDVSLAGAGSVLLVTGSNMSGKSTLLRAIGLSAVLAQAGAPVCASSMRLAPCVVRSSMRVSDSLRDGISRFYAELLKIKGVVDAAEQGRVLFLLDEILHGTNSRERHLGARSILRDLMKKGALGAVSTHDLALADLADDPSGTVRCVHFEEQVVDGQMTFDYRLREGVVRSGNALQWMRVLGLPVDEA